ncbi:PQQ-binding-like beta-propeller repeat protein [Umezawaea sp.]|uniref:outer membrane protein assembly factor BamB family protein n=1 Tax=Umezawaea sp. TaxID=1955258 RepID=UPI002ECFB776
MRWRTALPDRHVIGVSVAADGMCFVATGSGVLALDGPEPRWSADTAAHWGCLLFGDGLLVTGGADGFVVREQRTGAVVGAVEATPTSGPVSLGELLVFLAGQALRATTVTGEVRWEVDVPALYPPLVRRDTVVVAEDTAVRALRADGGPLWRVELSGEVDGSLVGLPGGHVLVPVRGDDHIGFVVVDPHGGVRPVPAHLPPGDLVVPVPGTGLLVLPGWPEPDDLGEPHAVVTVVDSGTGVVVRRHRVPAEAHGAVAGANGLVAVAGSPAWDYWAKYHGWPGYDLEDDCYVLFLDAHGARGEWLANTPITGPLAVAANGDLLVPVSGELVSLG